MPVEQLDRNAVAARTGLSVKSVDMYRHRPATGFPEPDGYFGRSPWWYSTTVDRWDAHRRRRGDQPASD